MEERREMNWPSVLVGVIAAGLLVAVVFIVKLVKLLRQERQYASALIDATLTFMEIADDEGEPIPAEFRDLLRGLD